MVSAEEVNLCWVQANTVLNTFYLTKNMLIFGKNGRKKVLFTPKWIKSTKKYKRK
jgi:hypothetical protein